ncbi:hypothetical protein OGAPHI_001535 [Ogataea philodendri]|uniref:P/Homo B domain-containing protein n=1 Tax=Ogataea philodendri TaxID=1378263 RepID=A0A9P8PDE2_9ASCO|nr:uncharacterized protein OGAPHI_001535 [Ogataea philodendri]KAH3669414.1 hypothetical protein OGAPHI_001535 [Ogataea philodendri]
MSLSIPQRDYRQNHYFMLEVDRGDVGLVLEQFPHVRYEHPSRALDKYQVFSISKSVPLEEVDLTIDRLQHLHDTGVRLSKRDTASQDPLHRRLAQVGVKAVHLLPPKKLARRAPVPVTDSSQEIVEQAQKEFKINDPIFSDQWHLINANFPGHDVNVLPVWRRNITGSGVVTALVDDGLDFESEDLAANFCAEGSYDFNDNDPLPRPRLKDDYHGTRCAAEIAAVKSNGVCGVGVAYNSKVAGIRILSAEINSDDEAVAMVHGLDVNDIYSCSWGPPDDGKAMDAPDKVIKEAMLKGIQDGRKNKGALYVFASGNGAFHGDSCNFDGYTNSIYSITVTSIDHKGLHPPYAESCTAVLVSTYSSGSGEHMHTSDINGKCTANHGGTSAAAPLAAGVYALVLEANPDLTWRDVQALSVHAAVEVESNDPSWQNSYLEGRRYSPVYGWGKVDAEKFVDAAQNWTLLKPQSWYFGPVQTVDLALETVDTVKSTREVTKQDLEAANLHHIEHVTVTVNIVATRRGDVCVTLVSPNGIRSELSQGRRLDNDQRGFKNWTFSSVAHWGEPGDGTWTLEVKNAKERNSLKVQDWSLHFFGECIDPAKAKRFSLDEDYTVKPQTSEEDKIDTPETTQIAPATSSTVAEVVSSTTSTIESATPTVDDGSKEDDGVYEQTDSHYEEYFLFFLALGFIICIWMLKTRKQPGRARRRDEYEFDIIQPEDDYDSEYASSHRHNSSSSIDPMATKARSSLDASKFKQTAKSDQDYLAREDQERERLFNTFNGVDETDPDGDEMYRITSHDSA